MSKWRYIDVGQADGHVSMGAISALSENLLENTLFVCRSKTFLYVGPQAKPSDYNRDFCIEHNIPVLRSDMAGGVFFYDGNQIIIVLAIKEDDPLSLITTSLGGKCIISAFRMLGINAFIKRDTNDVLIEGKKIAGLGTFNSRHGTVFFSASISLKLNMELAKQVLNLTKKDIEERKIQSLEEKIASLREDQYTFQRVKDAIRFGVEDVLNVEFYNDNFSESENLAIKRMADRLESGRMHLVKAKPRRTIAQLAKLEAGCGCR